ncbi:hypothetical protein T484DRAFT_1907203 [Baffinella frigidus]|nr:hypothetical protein T484DRAFT_1907203 [Cryptophyta sp. CCMP2293]
MGYGATDEPVAEEMQGMTDDEADVKSRKKKGKGGMKPGQALSFSGLEKRSHTGGDMLDMQVMLPRVIGGCCAMFVTIVLVACWIVHIIQVNSLSQT